MVNVSKYENVTDRAIRAILARSVPQDDGCILWPGTCSREGYGMSSYRGANSKKFMVYVHRAIYVALIGPVPGDMEVDHACHDPRTCPAERGPDCAHRRCVNTDHLRLLTPAANTHRSRNGVKTHCPADHEYDVAPGLGGARRCKRCNTAAKRRELACRRDEINARKRQRATELREARTAPEERQHLADIEGARDLLSSGKARRIREAAGLSQADLGALCGTVQSRVQTWETARCKPTGPVGAAYVRLIQELAHNISS